MDHPFVPSTAQSANQGDQPRQRTHQHRQTWFTGNGTKTTFALPYTPRDLTQVAVYVAGLRKRPADKGTAFDFTITGSQLIFAVAPILGAAIGVDQVSV